MKDDTLEILARKGFPHDIAELFKDELESFRADIERRAVPGWQPIETAPMGELLLVFQDMTGWCLRTQGDEGTWYDEHDNYDDSELEITHWMPLPAAPECSNAKEV